MFDYQGVPIGVTICEDIWFAEPMARARAAGARLMLNLNASPFHGGKQPEREAVVGERAREGGMPVVYVNQVGGQDELVFDGHSFVVDAQGQVSQRAPCSTTRACPSASPSARTSGSPSPWRGRERPGHD